MANDKYTLDVAINTADAANSIGDIKKSLKELKNIQLEYGEGTEEFTKAAQKAGELKDRLNAVNDSLKNLSNSPVENVKNSFGTLTSQLRTLDFEGAKQSLKDLGASSGVLVKGILGLGPGVNDNLGLISVKSKPKIFVAAFCNGIVFGSMGSLFLS